MTNTEIKANNNSLIRAKTSENSITKVNVADQLDASINYTDQKNPFKTYTALLSQSALDAPTAIILSNEAGITVTYARTLAGKYTATITGFVPNKTAVLIGSGFLETVVTASFQSNTLIQIRNFVLEAGVNKYYDSELNQIFFEIRVYN